jgi:deoxyribodipyrimidine photo-lyase
MIKTYATILDQVKTHDPSSYHNTRNYTNGAVTEWSPYISRGLLSPVVVMEELRAKYTKQAWMGFMQQMAWREYFQRVWQHKGDMILQDLKSEQTEVLLKQAPLPITRANTGIPVIDQSIQGLYEIGYLHNHLRMYLAMLSTNIFKAAWLPSAKWMYANLLDHDPAANFLSWQWVAGTFSSKKYVANQENINKYTGTKSLNTFLDTAYENLPHVLFDEAGQLKPKYSLTWAEPLDHAVEINTLQILEQLKQQNTFVHFNENTFNPDLPYCIYNSFNLDPLWHATEKVNRILLLEPKHFVQFPVTEKVLQFIIGLAQANIPNLQIYVGNFETLLAQITSAKGNISSKIAGVSPVMYFKEHPTTTHYQGIQEQRDWLFPQVTGYFPSFFGYWKKCEKFLK